jgi:hypothetical protein
MIRRMALFLFCVSSVWAVDAPAWRQVRIATSTTKDNFPQVTMGGQHPQSLDFCPTPAKDSKYYGAAIIDVGGVRTCYWDDTGITVTYPRNIGLYAPYGQSVKCHPTNPLILLACADNNEWDYITGGNVGGVYRSTDYGDTWTRVSTVSPNYSVIYPKSSSTINNTDYNLNRMRGDHQWFAYDPTDPTHIFWCHNQNWHLKLTLSSVTTIPRIPASGWDRDQSNAARDIISDTGTGAWLAVTAASTSDNSITGLINYTEYYTNNKQFVVENTISALRQGGAASTLVPTGPTIKTVTVTDDSEWLYESTDSGVTWSAATGSLSTSFNMDQVKGIVMNAAGTKLYVWSGGGLFVYDPIAHTIGRLGNSAVDDFWDFRINPNDPTKMWAAIGNNAGSVWYSADTGATWTREFLWTSTTYPTSLDIGHQSSSNMVMLSSGSGSVAGGSQQWSTNAGVSWSTSTNSVTTSEVPFGLVNRIVEGISKSSSSVGYATSRVRFRPDSDLKVYAYGSAHVWWSHDGGHTYHLAKNYSGAAIYRDTDMGFSATDDTAWGFGIADYYGIPITHDNGTTWTMGTRPTGVAGNYSRAICFKPGDSQKVIAGFGTYSNSIYAKSTNGGTSFTAIDLNQGTGTHAWAHWNEADTNIVYLGGYYSTDGGTTLTNIDQTGLTGAYDYQFAGVDAANNNTAYAYSLYTGYWAKSTDKGVTWSNWRYAYATTFVAAIQSQAVYDDTTMYIRCGNQNKTAWYRDMIYTTLAPTSSLEAGSTWTLSNAKNLDGNHDIQGNSIQCIAIDPRNKNVVYVLLNTNGIEKVWRSVDHGVNWTNITGNLSRVTFGGIAVKPTTGEVVLGGQLGPWVYPSYDYDAAGENPLWEKFSAAAGGDDPPIPPNHTPTVANINRFTVATGVAMQRQVVGNDQDTGDTLTYSIVSGAPTWISMSSGGLLTGTPLYPGIWTFIVKVNDGTIDSAPATITVDVTPFVNGQPVHRLILK